jgi:hypothetical protein
MVRQAVFRGVVDLANVIIAGSAICNAAVFEEARQIGPLLVLRQEVDSFQRYLSSPKCSP